MREVVSRQWMEGEFVGMTGMWCQGQWWKGNLGGSGGKYF